MVALVAVRAVVFDLDGTLVDTLADVAFAMNAALAALGLPTHPLADYRRWIGGGAADLAARATSGDPARTAEVLAVFRERYAGRLVVDSRPYEGIPPLLDELAARGLPLAVLSNKPHAPTVGVVAALLPRRFAVVHGQRDGVPKKPDPQGLVAIAHELGLAPGELAMVGDSGVDVATARAAGARPIGVLWGYRPEEELVKAGASRRLASPAELLDHLG